MSFNDPLPPIAVMHPPRGRKVMPPPVCCEHLLCLRKPRAAALRADDGVATGWLWLCGHHAGMPWLDVPVGLETSEGD
jgi:hypothetical protein